MVSTTTIRFLAPGYGAFNTASISIIELVVPRAGTLRNLFVRHNAAVGNGNNVVYTVFKNGVATLLSCTLATGAIGTASDVAHTVVIAQGDTIGIEVTKAAGIADGNVEAAAIVEVI